MSAESTSASEAGYEFCLGQNVTYSHRVENPGQGSACAAVAEVSGTTQNDMRCLQMPMIGALSLIPGSTQLFLPAWQSVLDVSSMGVGQPCSSLLRVSADFALQIFAYRPGHICS